MSIKLIAIDLDGTLLRDDCSVSARTKAAVEAAAAAGYYVVPTTGRSYRNARKVLKEFQGIEYFINANGATVANGPKEELIYREEIPYATAREIYDMVVQYESFAEIYEGLDAHVDAYGKEFLLRAGLTGSYVEQLMSTNIEHRCLDTFMENKKRRISKFHIVCSSADKKNQLQRRLSEIEGVDPVSVFSLNIEIVNKNWGKAGGLQKLTEYLGISPREVMAIGDSDNDLDMLEWAGFSVAMGNANEQVKALADVITKNHNQDGVAKALEEYLQLS